MGLDPGPPLLRKIRNDKIGKREEVGEEGRKRKMKKKKKRRN